MADAASPATSSRAELKALAALLALVTLHVATLELREPGYFLRDDNAAYYLSVYVHGVDTLFGSGELAQLNYHQYLGQPHLAMGQTATLYPPIYFAAAGATLWQGDGLGDSVSGDARAMIFLLVLGHLLMSAAGFYLLARSWTVPTWIAAGSALVWATFPFLVVVSRNWIIVAYAAAWLPWSLFFLEAWLSRGMRWALVGYAAAKALFCFQGYAQYVILATLFEGVYVVLRTLVERRVAQHSWWRRASGLVAGLAASGGLAAPLLLPMWQAKEDSQARSGDLSLEEFLSNSLDLGITLKAQFFVVAERAVHQGTGAIFYVGLPVLLAVLAGWLLLLRRRQSPVRQTTLLLAAAAVALLLSTKAVRVLQAVPLLGSFRWPFKSFLWVLLFGALAFAVVLGRLVARSEESRASGSKTSVALAAVALALGVGGNVVATHWNDWDRPFGPNRVARSVPELQEHSAETLVGSEGRSEGRVVAMWMGHGQDDIERFLTHNYATLAGASSLGGYEPLIPQLNFDLAKGLEYSNIWRYELTRASLDYLSEWSVRWLLMPDKPRNRGIVSSFPELRTLEEPSVGGLLVVENTAAAPYAFLEPDDGGTPLPMLVEFGASGLRVDLEKASGRGGLLRLQIAPLDGYGWSADGGSTGEIGVDGGGHIVLEIPAGTGRVEVKYAATAFRLGVALSLVTLLLLFEYLRRRHR